VKLIYIAGPYSADTKEQIETNVALAVHMGNLVANAGYAVFIPHLSHYWDAIFPHEYKFWMDQDNAVLERCDAVLRLTGASRGADQEVHLALTTYHIPVYFSLQELLDDNGSRTETRPE
jgi:hypothetical protein